MREHVTDGYATLTEKEKQTLRLIVRGHDAKSTARHLGLSVHTINERLRDARRKLAVSSSREAARMVFEREGSDPKSVADEEFREAVPPQDVKQDSPGQIKRRARIGTGAVIMSLVLGFLALFGLPQIASNQDGGTSSVEAVNSAVVASAKAWLALVDQRKWDESWAATASSFKKSNTKQLWATTAEKVQVPLGATRSRVLFSQDSVPTPPNGAEVVKFRTSFANKPDAVETLALAKENGNWRVVGYYIE
jgi:DNA-binding CsgD family transcriptional regulator